MAGGDHFLKLRRGHMSVDLRRGDVCVPKQHLDAAKVGAAIQKFGGESVPQDVRTDEADVDTGHLGGFIQQLGESPTT